MHRPPRPELAKAKRPEFVVITVCKTAWVGKLRFGTGIFGSGRDDLVAAVRATESLGYDTFVLPDHLFDQLSPIPALAVVAELSESLRIGTWVLCNDFHHPVIVARELATLDVLSRGRLDVGLGAGYIRFEYDSSGIPFEAGGRRLQRLQDSVAVIKALFGSEPVTLDNEHFHLRDQIGFPAPVQQPHPPLLLGGGGRKMLSWAAVEADIVSVVPAAAPGGGLRASDLKLGVLQEKIGWIRESAESRFDGLELNVGLWDMVVTRDRRKAARRWLDALAGQAGVWVLDGELTEDDLLTSPYVAFGTHQEIAEHIQQIQSLTGVDYYTIFPHLLESFGPVLQIINQ